MEKEILEEFGLKENEARVYLSLLKEGSCTASKLAKSAKINRTTAYLELENLIEKGLASYVIKDAKKYFQATKPKKLIEILEEKKLKIKSILPKLESLQSNLSPFSIDVFEGKEGIKTFYQDILTHAEEFLVFGATGKATEILEFEYPHFVKKFSKAKIKEKALANSNARKIMESHPKKLMKVKFLPEEYTAEVTTIIYKNKVAIQSLQKENLYVIVIKDPLLAKSYKNYFNFMWAAVDNL